MFEKIKSFLFENKTTKQTFAKNTVWLSISNFGGRLFKAVIVIYAARVLGTAGWGVASYVLTLAGFLTMFIDPGINGLLMREASKGDSDQRLKYFSTTVVIKVTLLLSSVFILIFIAPYFTLLPGAVILIPFSAFIILFDGMREFFSAFMRSLEKMEWEAGVFLLTNLAIVAFGFILMTNSATPRSFLLGYATGTAIGAVAAAFVLRKYFKKIFSYFSVQLIPSIMKSAWPFAITGALGVLLTNTDILVISWMRSESDVGIYAAAIRLIQVLYILPMIFQYATLPIIARLANHDNHKFRVAFERTVSLVFFVSIPIALGGVILGAQIINLIFGTAYAGGGLALRILMLTMLVDYPATIISTGIFAYDRQKNLIICSAIGGFSNVILDLILIPTFGISGSAVATLLAQIASNWYLWHTMKKINNFEVLSHLRNIIIASAVMAVATLGMFLLGVNVIINIALSGALYLGLLYLLREPLLAEARNIVFRQAPSPVESV